MVDEGQRLGKVSILMVDSVRSAIGRATIVLGLGPHRRRYEIRLDLQPDSDAAAGEIPVGTFPLAVRIQVDRVRESVPSARASCLLRTERGPRRISISVPAALALVRSGIHGVVAVG